MMTSLLLQAASLACAVRVANATHSLGAALRAFQRITLRDWQTPLLQFIRLKLKVQIVLVKIIPVGILVNIISL